MIIEWLALFAILPTRVVLAIVADPAGHPPRSLVNCFVEVAGSGMIVAVARSAGVRLLADRGLPRQIVVEVLALLAVETLGVVGALASTVDHVLLIDDAG